MMRRDEAPKREWARGALELLGLIGNMIGGDTRSEGVVGPGCKEGCKGGEEGTGQLRGDGEMNGPDGMKTIQCSHSTKVLGRRDNKKPNGMNQH